jgi:hypothetical protein
MLNSSRRLVLLLLARSALKSDRGTPWGAAGNKVPPSITLSRPILKVADFLRDGKMSTTKVGLAAFKMSSLRIGPKNASRNLV